MTPEALPSTQRGAARARLGLALVVGLALATSLWAIWRPSVAPEETHGAAANPAARARIVSLAPSLTETLFAIGAADVVVGVSDYCAFPPEAKRPPSVGSALTPSYEAIARLAPTLIVATQVGGEQLGPLSRIAPTEQLPWLSLAEVISSTRALGRLVGRESSADALAEKLARVLDHAAPANAPRVLFVMSYGDVDSNDIWYIRDDSLHGAALRAAGARNAISSDRAGQPRLSVEELFRVDPDQIVFFVDGEGAPSGREHARFSKLTPLRAVQQSRLGAVNVPGALNGGPRVLDLVPPLAAEIRRLEAIRP